MDRYQVKIDETIIATSPLLKSAKLFIIDNPILHHPLVPEDKRKLYKILDIQTNQFV